MTELGWFFSGLVGFVLGALLTTRWFIHWTPFIARELMLEHEQVIAERSAPRREPVREPTIFRIDDDHDGIYGGTPCAN